LIASALRGSPGFLLSDAFAPGGLDAALSVSVLGIRLRDLFGSGLNAAAAPLVVLGLVAGGLAVAAFLRRSAGSTEAQAPTWLCGYQELNAANRYQDRAMFAAFKHFFRWTGGRTAPRAGRGQGGRP